jgi:hypothetical protein
VKPRLTVLLGAGSTISLDPDHPTRPGTPSTSEITQRVINLQFPKAVLAGTPFLQTATSENTSAIHKTIPVLQSIYRALLGTFESANFELILHTIEQILPLAAMQVGAASSGQFHPAIGAFVEMQKRYDLLKDWSLLRVTRQSVISEIHSQIRYRSFNLAKHLPLHQFVAELAKEFQLAIFTMILSTIHKTHGSMGLTETRICLAEENIGSRLLSTHEPSMNGKNTETPTRRTERSRVSVGVIEPRGVKSSQRIQLSLA